MRSGAAWSLVFASLTAGSVAAAGPPDGSTPPTATDGGAPDGGAVAAGRAGFARREEPGRAADGGAHLVRVEQGRRGRRSGDELDRGEPAGRSEGRQGRLGSRPGHGPGVGAAAATALRRLHRRVLPGGALGRRRGAYVVTGRLDRLGKGYVLTASLYDSVRAVSVAKPRAESSDDDGLRRAAERSRPACSPRSRPASPTARARPESPVTTGRESASGSSSATSSWPAWPRSTRGPRPSSAGPSTRSGWRSCRSASTSCTDRPGRRR